MLIIYSFCSQSHDEQGLPTSTLYRPLALASWRLLQQWIDKNKCLTKIYEKSNMPFYQIEIYNITVNSFFLFFEIKDRPLIHF